ncbi:MAG: DUF1045 domain-containing protein [Pseudomonadota bacterium]|nr:DUF1045 domain-containing protein [Pseudomonadota bacterium]
MPPAPNVPRYAIYFAPAPDTGLAAAGRGWLSETPPTVPGLDRERVLAITADARHYGFHATLKAPVELADGCTEAGLLDQLAGFAERANAPVVPMRVASLGGFLAVVPEYPPVELQDFAAEVVEAFEPFRAPLTDHDRARRRPEALTPRQRDLLERYGYPYVLDEFRFHMTLTCRLQEPEREVLREFLADRFAPVLSAPVAVNRLAVFRQPDRDSPFAEIAAATLRAVCHQTAI